MLHGINILGWFDKIEDQRWNNSDVKGFIVSFKQTMLPCFILGIDTVETIAVVKLYNSLNVLIATNNTATVVNSNGLKIVRFVGSKTEDFEDGYYYYTITMGTKLVYSEMFCLTSDTSSLFGINIVSGDLTYSAEHLFPFNGLEIDFYLPCNGVSIHNETKEDGSEKYFGDIPSFSAVNIIRKSEINGTVQIFKMLSYLRSFLVNGLIHISYGGYINKIYDTVTELKDEDSFGDTIIINLSYREFDFIASRNAI